jgi:hypothetical protein
MMVTAVRGRLSSIAAGLDPPEGQKGFWGGVWFGSKSNYYVKSKYSTVKFLMNLGSKRTNVKHLCI